MRERSSQLLRVEVNVFSTKVFSLYTHTIYIYIRIYMYMHVYIHMYRPI